MPVSLPIYSHRFPFPALSNRHLLDVPSLEPVPIISNTTTMATPIGNETSKKRFPNELLLAIFEVASQPTLAIVCAVSRLWRSLATPLLYRQPITSDVSQFERILVTVAAKNELGSVVKRICAPTFPNFSETARRIQDSHIERLCSACPNLIYLGLLHCRFLGDEGVFAIAEHCRGLEVLSLSGCEGVGDLGILRVSANLHALKTLKLSHTTVTDLSCEQIGRNCQLLQHLDVSFTAASFNGIDFIVNALARLVHLDVRGCLDSAQQVDWIREHGPESFCLVADDFRDWSSSSGSDADLSEGSVIDEYGADYDWFGNEYYDEYNDRLLVNRYGDFRPSYSDSDYGSHEFHLSD
ncbi:hypothetical protein BDK51DRAFT_29291 [Blyttiomyces helicus]|uniref:Uncharacterized protein n=1 Tax=Blyttiomyces helicus TaxID=388810 RepID=A0A4P9W9Q9_9FUNG|nr:hypothetical protein BDK51DRAFT_29291 [Blyttiomyces helicus]|eukprot:RKO88255.1 hypothetical protein BDK51DRAFT_29291 [Blyttiomyces helicus]